MLSPRGNDHPYPIKVVRELQAHLAEVSLDACRIPTVAQISGLVRQEYQDLPESAWKILKEGIAFRSVCSVAAVRELLALVKELSRVIATPEGWYAAEQLVRIAAKRDPDIEISKLVEFSAFLRDMSKVCGAPAVEQALVSTVDVLCNDSQLHLSQVCQSASIVQELLGERLGRGYQRSVAAVRRSLRSVSLQALHDVVEWAADFCPPGEQHVIKNCAQTLALGQHSCNPGEVPDVRILADLRAPLEVVIASSQATLKRSEMEFLSRSQHLLISEHLPKALSAASRAAALRELGIASLHDLVHMAKALSIGVPLQEVSVRASFGSDSGLGFDQTPESVVIFEDPKVRRALAALFKECVESEKGEGAYRLLNDMACVLSESSAVQLSPRELAKGIRLLEPEILAEIQPKLLVSFLQITPKVGRSERQERLRRASRLFHECPQGKRTLHEKIRVCIALSASSKSDPYRDSFLQRWPESHDVTALIGSVLKEAAGDINLLDREYESLLSEMGQADEAWAGVSARARVSRPGKRRGPVTQDLTDIREAFKSVHLPTPETIEDVVKLLLTAKAESSVRSDLIGYLQSGTRRERDTHALNMRIRYETDSGPYPYYLSEARNIPNPEYVKMLTDRNEIFRRIFDLHYGFSPRAFDARRPPRMTTNLLQRAGRDLAAEVCATHRFAVDVFPGPGWLLSGLLPERFFVGNPSTPGDPWSSYKEAWPWASQEIADLHFSKFFFSRGVGIVMAPSLPKYLLNGVHYGLIYWNEHFSNPSRWAAALVPVPILRRALDGLIYNEAAPMQNLSIEEQRLRGDGLRYETLFAQGREYGAPLLNLGWASNLGGLCNAYPPGAAPFFAWERSRIGHSKDAAGHIHKSHILGTYRSETNQEMEAALQPLRHAHDEVYRIASAYLNLHDLYRLARSLWNKGLTPTASESDAFRMLDEAYRWRSLRERGTEPETSFPILCLAPTLDSWNRVRSNVLLDTYDMTLVAPSFRGELPSGRGSDYAYARDIWTEFVLPLYREDSGLDLRFMDRREMI